MEKINLKGPVEDRQEKVTSFMYNEMEEATITEVLIGLIHGSGFSETVACLDMIAMETKKVLILMGEWGRIYPHPDVALRPIGPVLKPDPGFCKGTVELAKAGNPGPTGLKAVEHIYKGGFFKNRHKLSWRCAPVCMSLINTFNLDKYSTVIDLGCAIGDYVNWFTDNGIIAWGVEGSKVALDFAKTSLMQIHDLRTPLPGDVSKYGYTLAYSLEVAEHIEPEYAGIYLDNLCRLAPTVLMTAAGPDQGGHGHVNCQEKDYWVDLMTQRHYYRDLETEIIWKKELKPFDHRKEVNCYINNAMVFRATRMTGRHDNG